LFSRKWQLKREPIFSLNSSSSNSLNTVVLKLLEEWDLLHLTRLFLLPQRIEKEVYRESIKKGELLLIRILLITKSSDLLYLNYQSYFAYQNLWILTSCAFSSSNTSFCLYLRCTSTQVVRWERCCTF
jgi:hypothetical protein